MDIIIAAEQLFVEKGYSNTTMDIIANVAEFSKATIYNYFPTKEADLVGRPVSRLLSETERML